jgi:long-chain acyl-CoA synthetase
VPDWEVLRARRPELPEAPPEEMVAREDVRRLLREEIDHCVCGERGFRTFELITRFTCLARPFSAEEGTLTHTLKKRRSVIEERFAAVIAELYEE